MSHRDPRPNPPLTDPPPVLAPDSRPDGSAAGVVRSFGPGFCSEAAEAVTTVALFVAFALAWIVFQAEPYPLPEPMPVDAPNPAPFASSPTVSTVWLVDGFNVLHVGVLGGRDRREWWKEGARAELLSRLRSLPERGAEVWVVFDGRRPAPAAESPDPRLRVVFAPSADEWLLERVRSDAEPARLAVVTADRSLAERARRRGARVVSPRAFLGTFFPISVADL